MPGPLDGLKVVEMTGLGPAPLAGQLLADQGAEVIVIDRKSAPRDTTDVNRRGKRSIALNLKSEAGLNAARTLISRADVLIEGFRPGVMEKLGLGPEACHADNPGLIFARMTGWGQTGPWAHTAGHDINYLGLTGALAAIGRADDTPVPPLNLVADFGGGTMFLLFGILSALFERQRSGKGQTVDASMVDGVSQLMGLMHQAYGQGHWQLTRESNMLDGGAPFYRVYECADGKYLSVGALEPQFYDLLLEHADLPQADRAIRLDPTTWPEMRSRYAEAFRSRTRDAWMEIFGGTDACVGPVLTLDEVEAHPHNAARGTFLRRDDVLQSAPAPRFDRTPAPAPGPIRAPGADGDAILAEAGLSAAEIETMRQSGDLT